MSAEYAHFVLGAMQFGLIEKEDSGLIKPGKENTPLSSFYQDNKSSIDQVAEQAKEELHLRSSDNGNYHFVEQFVANLPQNLKAALIRGYAHLPVHLDGLSGALAFYTDVYQQHKKAMEEIMGMTWEELFPEKKEH